MDQRRRDPCQLVWQVKKFFEQKAACKQKPLHLPDMPAGVERGAVTLASLTKLLHLPDKPAGVGRGAVTLASRTKLLHLRAKPAGVVGAASPTS